jgi:hypothetical protein
MCSSEPRSLISLLNAAKEQPAGLAIVARILAIRLIAMARKQRTRWLILAVPMAVNHTNVISLILEYKSELIAQTDHIAPLRLFSGHRQFSRFRVEPRSA